MNKKTVIITAFFTIVILSAVLNYTMSVPQGVNEEDSELEWSLRIEVNREVLKIYDVSELSSRAHPLNITSHGEPLIIQAVSLTSLLEENNIDSSDVVLFTPLALDGFSVDVNGTHIQNAYVRIVEDENVLKDGALRMVVTDLSQSTWVKFLVEINFDLQLEEQ